jgi:hypothetical protein
MASFSFCNRTLSGVPAVCFPRASSSMFGGPDSFSMASLLPWPVRGSSSPFHTLVSGGCKFPDVGGEMLAGLRCSDGLAGDFGEFSDGSSPGDCDVGLGLLLDGSGGIEALISSRGAPSVTRSAESCDIGRGRELLHADALFGRRWPRPARCVVADRSYG